MTTITMKELLEAGVHFGHQTRRWNPKMAKYIFAERNGIYIIDLQKTLRLLQTGCEFLQEVAIRGGAVLFVGTKKQAQETVIEEATRCQMFYVNHRWLGGMLTNYQTIKRSIERLTQLETDEASGLFEKLPKKEVTNLRREKTKLNNNLAGIKTMGRLPEAIIVTDTRKEHTAILEANKLGIPVVAIVDTNCDPDPIDFPIPGNDDAIRAVKLICASFANAIIEGRASALEGADVQEAPPPALTAPGLTVPDSTAPGVTASETKELEKGTSPGDDDTTAAVPPPHRQRRPRGRGRRQEPPPETDVEA